MTDRISWFRFASPGSFYPVAGRFIPVFWVLAAVFGSKDAVKYWPLSANDRFKALQAGDVDVLARGRPGRSAAIPSSGPASRACCITTGKAS